jgi:hypothetical protein
VCDATVANSGALTPLGLLRCVIEPTAQGLVAARRARATLQADSKAGNSGLKRLNISRGGRLFLALNSAPARPYDCASHVYQHF